MQRNSRAPGKIILSGEYAVVFGYPGIAIPANVGVEVQWEDTRDAPMKIILEGAAGSESYARKIVDQCITRGGLASGTLTIKNSIPVGRGMGSSTALVIAICRCLLGEENRGQALEVENIVNPGNSGLDFAVIWENKPVKFTKGQTPEIIDLPSDLLRNSVLVDTGMPGESTAELVAWMKTRTNEPAITEAFKTIGTCTERILAGEDLMTVMRDHHRAQMTLGVVTPEAQTLIAEIEKAGGSAKVLGAGARTGGGGMVLGIGSDIDQIRSIAALHAVDFNTSVSARMS